MPNPLQLIPEKARLTIYLVYAFAVIALGSVLAAYAAVQITAPLWVVAALAGLTFAGSALGFVAASNVGTAAAQVTVVNQATTDPYTTASHVNQQLADDAQDETTEGTDGYTEDAPEADAEL